MNYIPQDKLIDQFKTLGRSVVVSHGAFEIPATCEISDLDWNQMDQDHRPWIHRTYTEALRIATLRESQLSITRLRLFGIPFFVQVTDLRVAPSTYYQGYTLFNLIYVHAVTHCLPKLHRGEWYIVSHWVFKPLHFFIDRRLQRMNRVQNAEDVPVRDRRADLRKRGFGFVHENPDFVTANLKTNNVVFPTLAGPQTVKLEGLIEGERNSVGVGPIQFLIRPDGAGRYSVWNEVCPHEGGPMREGKLCGDEIQCQWHGLKFGCAKLGPDQPTAILGGFQLSLDSSAGVLRVTSFSSKTSP